MVVQNADGIAGVGILVARRWVEKVIGVNTEQGEREIVGVANTGWQINPEPDYCVCSAGRKNHG